MKRFWKKFCLYLIPFVVCLVLFVAFEPSDYLLLRGDAPYSAMPLSSMRDLMRNKPSRIILGDSKMANLNLDYIQELTGREYAMLGFGGATLGENIATFWFAIEHIELEEVVFGLSFYSARNEYSAGKMTDMIDIAENPLSFMARYDYWLQAVNSGRGRLMASLGGLLNKPEWIPPDPEDPTAFTVQQVPQEMGQTYRADIETYNLENVYPMCMDYYFEQQTLDALQEVIDYCDENGIQLTFVFTPTHMSLVEMVQVPLGILDITPMLKQFVLGKAAVVDMEFDNDFTRDDNNFFDSFHLMGDRKPLLAQWIFTDVESEYVLRYDRDGNRL